jgi:hypothetical protein
MSCISTYGSTTDSLKTKLRFKGFIKADAIFDSRQTVSARESFVLMYAKKPQLDKNGADINARPQYNQYATSSRLIISIDTFRTSNFFITSLIETDFTGASESTNSGLRLRHAYLKLENSHHSLLVGQYWHPLVAPEVFPDMLSLNLGNPIKSAMRAPQVRYQYQTKYLDFIGVASMHRDNASIGPLPLGVSSDYLRNQVIPSLDFQTIYRGKNWMMGAGCDYKRINMSIKSDSNYKVNEYVTGFSGHVFGKVDFKKITIKAQYIWGQNLYDQAMLGGVGITSIDTTNYQRSFSPIAQQSVWINVASKFKKLNFSIFAGVAQNLGSEKAFTGAVYARGNDIAYLYRIAPQISYKVGKVIFFSETEYTGAAFGTADAKGIVKNTKECGVFRENLAVLFLF